jgi:CBS domain-containing protein
MRVEEVMTRNVVTVSENNTLLEAAEILRKNKISGAPVLSDEGELVGIISEADVLKVLEAGKFSFSRLFHLFEKENVKEELERAAKTKVKDVMSKNPQTIDVNASIYEVASIMHSKGFNRLPVVEGGKLVGIVARADVLAAL